MSLRPFAPTACRRASARVRASLVALVVSVLLQPHLAVAQQPPDILPGAGRVTLEGELEVLYEDYPTHSRLLHFLHADNRRIPLRIAEGQEPDLPTGAYVRIVGDLADGIVTTSSITSLATTATATAVTQNVLVILFNFSNNVTQAFDAATVASINDQVRSYYLENTYGQAALSFTVVGWYTIAATNTTCDYVTWATQAEAKATNAGVNLAAFSRRVFAFPSTAACGWSGMGNVSGPRSWTNGSYTVRTIAHEQGHNFGNHHSKASRCDTTGCTVVEYGDDRDILGVSGVVGHMNAFQKQRLGWMSDATAASIHTVTTSGDYWIANYESSTAATKALKIWNPATSSYYYVESRTKIGFDATVPSGVTMHSESAGIGYQLDFDAVTSAYDSTLDVGQVFANPAIGLTVQTLSTSADGAMIRIGLGGAGATCSTQPHTITLTTTGSLVYSVSVKNNNSAGCAASSFTLSAALPTGWTKVFSPSSLAAVSPGSTASAVLTLTAPTGSVGTYSFSVTATDVTSGRSVSTTGSVTLVTSLQVTASASVSGSIGNRYATIVVTTKAATQLVSGAAVTVVVTSPTGIKTTLQATSGSIGMATVKMSLKRAARGTYQVLATSLSGGVSGSATTSFNVP
jgi:hypothetical protein